jgi:hypothetical protein
MLSGLESILYVVFSDYINREIPSRQRATILSFESMFFSALMTGFFPVVGAISQYRGFKTTFAFISATSFVLMTVSSAMMLKDKRVLKKGVRKQII